MTDDDFHIVLMRDENPKKDCCDKPYVKDVTAMPQPPVEFKRKG